MKEKTEKNICLINIDSYRCNGCESCVSIAPELFIINEDSGKAETASDTAPCSDELSRAAAICPMECIEIEPAHQNH